MTITTHPVSRRSFGPRGLLVTCAASLALAASLVGCGGGGGGGDSFVGAATPNLRVQPSRIDSGDRSEVSVELRNVHDNGIALKFRYPDGLRYVPNTAVLLVGEREIDLTPTVNAISEDDDVFLVFYLTQSQFRPSGREYNGEPGTVALQLEGVSAIRDGRIEVDPDVDDPDEDNSVEFDIENPEFAAEDERSIEVID